MPSATRRVKTIYSVIASSNRLEIIRILNSKGPLSYSELKSLSGFKSKKESGKFAYHLRKLVRQMLVSLNKSERKYSVTSLGRLILNLTRQIEEQSIVESGKIYVRTSRERMEEFNPDKILQSLVKEAGMPVEEAQKITSEAESRLYKFPTSYLTSPLIREIVNAILIEHGYENYRHKLTRLGLPINDITQLINNTARGIEAVDSLLYQTSRAAFSEYLLLNQIPRDVADAHIQGDIHISNRGSWGLKPDTVFIDLSSITKKGINYNGKFLFSPRIDIPKNINESFSSMSVITALLSKQVSEEIVFFNFIEYISQYVENKTNNELKEIIYNTFRSISQKTSSFVEPLITFYISIEEKNMKNADIIKVKKALLDAYSEYIDNVPIPNIAIVIQTDLSKEKDINKITNIILKGGLVAFLKNEEAITAYSGIRNSINKKRNIESINTLHSVSVNLPRLAYESNNDEQYFRARFALMLQTAISALAERRNIIEDMIRKGITPLLSQNSGLISSEKMPLIINLTGLEESVEILKGGKLENKNLFSLYKKIIDTGIKVCKEEGEKVKAEFGLSNILTDAHLRFARLDVDKYGRVTTSNVTEDGYSQTIIFTAHDILNQDFATGINSFINKMSGGCAPLLDISKLKSGKNIAEAITLTNKAISFFKCSNIVSICKSCTEKQMGELVKCKNCNSTEMLLIKTQYIPKVIFS